jgi:hypothetical protein
MQDTLDDQPPGKLPDVNTITLANVDGNQVVLDLGGGVYAFYAHLRKKSIPVTVGQHVKRGQLLGKLAIAETRRRPICTSTSWKACPC